MFNFSVWSVYHRYGSPYGRSDARFNGRRAWSLTVETARVKAASHVTPHAEERLIKRWRERGGAERTTNRRRAAAADPETVK